MDDRGPRIAGGSPKDQQDPWQDALEGPKRGETHSVFGLRDRGRLEARDRENRGAAQPGRTECAVREEYSGSGRGAQQGKACGIDLIRDAMAWRDGRRSGSGHSRAGRLTTRLYVS